MDSARHVIKRNMNPPYLCLMASYDVVSGICQGASSRQVSSPLLRLARSTPSARLAVSHALFDSRGDSVDSANCLTGPRG